MENQAIQRRIALALERIAKSLEVLTKAQEADRK
jgi:hypothetical protein